MERGRIIVNNTDYTGSFVTPNPSEPPTKDLNTLEIEGEVFNIAGSGGGGVGDITNYYGVFIDTNNIIQSFVHITDTAEHTYIATEDCAVVYYIPNDTNTDVYIKLDGIQVGGQYGQYVNATSDIVYMKKGQVFSYQTTYTVSTGAGYTVYGLQSGDRIPALIQDAQIYSLEEKQVGVWTDGKPLYQKTVSFPTNTSQTFSVNLDVQNVEHIFLVPDGCYGNNGTWTIPYITGTNYLNNIGGFFDNLGEGNTATFEMRVGQESAPYNQGGVLTFRYTKTTDEEGSGGYQAYGMSPVIYSTKEREIGVWINNKPLYQKTLVFEDYTNGTYQDVSSLNIEEIVNNFGEHRLADYNYGLSFPYYENNNWYSLMTFDKNNGRYYVYCSSQMADIYKRLFITIQYTKTTDSPKRTGYELLDIQENQIIVDATRYSTEEKIIGTWIDNKPLYQKTYVISSIPSNSYDYYNFASNVDKVINYQGMVIDTSSDASMNIYYVRPDNTKVQFYTQILADKRFFFRTYTSWTASAYITFYYTKTTDAVGSGGYQAYGFSPIIYSTEEREVGVWIDNKPLYAKSFTLSSQITVSASSWTNTDLSLSDVEKFVNGYAISDDGTFQGSVVVDKSNDVIQLQSTRSSASYVKYLTVFYTKTTDVAGSGEYNTLGIPNVHYDGNEKIIGTWFGETLYQKTLVIHNESTVSSNTTITTIDSTFRVKNWKAFAIEYGVNYQIPYVAGSGSASFYFRENGNVDFTITNTSFAAGSDFYITIEYTKTTD